MIRAALVATMLWTGPAMAECRQALALGLDVSGSVDLHEYRLQLDGLAAALLSPEVVQKLLASPEAPVRVMVYEWSGPRDLRVVVPWTDISDGAALAGVTAQLQATARQPSHPSTAIGNAITAGYGFLTEQTACWKRTLDISGDGEANTGVRPQDVAAPPAGITVNGLAIGDALAPGNEGFMELIAYYRAYVIRGPDAFVESALGFEDYQRAMERKLLRELEALALGGLQ